MSSLLTQIRPAPSELIERREGVRKYQPDYPLNRYVTIPSQSERRDPKPPPLRVRAEGAGPHPASYTTSYGPLSGDLKDQFARHYQWKTTSQREYVRHHPPLPPLPPARFEPRADMVRLRWPGQGAHGGPFEYQKVVASGCQLPEAKAWPLVSNYFQNFPNNVDGPAKRFREVKHNIGGRTPEDTAKVRDHIRQLVKDQSLNPQFVKPMPGFKGVQNEARVFEGLDRTPGRNPPDMHTEYIAQYNRHIPSHDYRRPQFALDNSLAKTVVLSHPYNHFNHADHNPPLLDYIPMP